MKTIKNKNFFYTHGWQGDIDLLEELSEYGIFGSGDFLFNETSHTKTPNVFFRVYHTEKETTLTEAMEGHIKRMCGSLEAEGSSYGYSEVTIEGFNLSELKIGGHDIQKILDGFPGEYLHVLIDVLPG